MKKLGKKGFTLIELIAVLVILAILALIVTPMVMNIVKKAKDASNRRSVDAYGKAVELAVATYLLDNGDYPESLDNLTVEYSGNEVTCNTKILNDDGSIYLSGCSVKNTEVLDSNNADGYYHYGKTDQVSISKEYKKGDKISYNGIDFYVIEDSASDFDSIKLMLVEPIKMEDMNNIIPSNINEYIDNDGKYILAPFYASDECVYDGDMTGCTNEYNQSIAKQIVDAWTNKYITSGDLKEEARLITRDELITNFGYEHVQGPSNSWWESTENTPRWVNAFQYWIMGSEGDDSRTLTVDIDKLAAIDVTEQRKIRPVFTLSKKSVTKSSTYNIGDTVTYNGVDYYAIEDSYSSDDNVILLKKTALTVEEVNQYGGVAGEYDGYGEMAYYSSETCENGTYSGCTNHYENSKVKSVVDAWKEDRASLASEARLITYDELMDNLGYSYGNQAGGTSTSGRILANTEYTPSWVFDAGLSYDTGSTGWYYARESFMYWAMSSVADSLSDVWCVGFGEWLDKKSVYENGLVRPVIVLPKSALNS